MVGLFKDSEIVMATDLEFRLLFSHMNSNSLEYQPATLGRRTAFKMHVYDEKCSASPVVIGTSFTVNYISMSKFAGIRSI